MVITALIAVSFLVRFLLFPIPGYKNDMGTFEAWFRTAADNGLRSFYSLTRCDYPPFNVYLFWSFGSIAKAFSLFGTPQIAYIIKLVPAIFDAAMGFLIFVFVRSRLNFKMAAMTVALYVFNPAIIYNSAVWGQFDAIYTFFLVLSLILALASKPELSAVTYAGAVLTKPQAIALLPLIAYLILRKGGWRRLATSLMAGAATVFVVILPFEWSNPVTFLADNYFFGYNEYAYTSVNAFNTWALGGLWIQDTLVTFVLGWILFGALALFILYPLHKRFGASGELLVLFSAFVLFFGFFMLPTRIHERYLFPAISMLALMFLFLKKIRPLYVILTSTLFVNIAYVLYWLNVYANAGYTYGPSLTGDPVVLAVSLINLVAFLYVLVLMWNELKGRYWFRISPLKIGSTTNMEAEKNENRIKPQ
jgi:dolichyl-phosphate-mannose-protein mannosyltransferase